MKFKPAVATLLLVTPNCFSTRLVLLPKIVKPKVIRKIKPSMLIPNKSFGQFKFDYVAPKGLKNKFENCFLDGVVTGACFTAFATSYLLQNNNKTINIFTDEDLRIAIENNLFGITN